MQSLSVCMHVSVGWWGFMWPSEKVLFFAFLLLHAFRTITESGKEAGRLLHFTDSMLQAWDCVNCRTDCSLEHVLVKLVLRNKQQRETSNNTVKPLTLYVESAQLAALAIEKYLRIVVDGEHSVLLASLQSMWIAERPVKQTNERATCTTHWNWRKYACSNFFFFVSCFRNSLLLSCCLNLNFLASLRFIAHRSNSERGGERRLGANEGSKK